ncbi:MAG: tetratricopeptide repeat protein [Anaerolineales bacterium]
MAADQVKAFLKQGIALAREGEKDQAREYFQNAIRLDPQNEAAWLWMSSVARDNRERLFCLKNLLQINPENEMALKGLRALGVDPQTVLEQAPAETAGASTGMASPPGGNVPALSREHLRNVFPVIEQFMRDHQSLALGGDEALWQPKQGLRYGEAVARRRRTMRYAAMAGAGIFAILVVGLLLATLLLGGGEDAFQIAANATLTPSLTPSNTPTATPGVTNTPSPMPPQPQPTFAPPDTLIRGSVFGSTSTPVYPAIAGRGRDFEQAVRLYAIGDYPAAFDLFAAERALDTITCDPRPYYFHVLGLAELGGRSNLEQAEALVQEALARDGCADEPMMFDAACQVDFQQGVAQNDPSEFETAGQWCRRAVDGDPRLIPATVTYARLFVQGDEPDFTSAAAILDSGLDNQPSNVNLLLARADIEVRRGEIQRAIEFISQALYVDPLSDEALAQRVEAYLRVAARADDSQERLQLYGTAVLWAQEYLLFYPGAPEAYVLLARARLGEGNDALAEEALSRVIAAENDLPERDQDIVAAAYALRADLYMQQARYAQALDDTAALLQEAPQNLALIEQQADLAYLTARYALALDGIETVLDANPERVDLQLRQAEILTERCLFTNEVDCEYGAMFELLTDDFIAALEGEQQRRAQAYRAKVEYHLTIVDETLSPAEQSRFLELGLDFLEPVLEANETGLDQYYRGLFLEALDNPEEALRAYDWVLYWAQFYDYPFEEAVQERAEALRAEGAS